MNINWINLVTLLSLNECDQPGHPYQNVCHHLMSGNRFSFPCTIIAPECIAIVNSVVPLTSNVNCGLPMTCGVTAKIFKLSDSLFERKLLCITANTYKEREFVGLRIAGVNIGPFTPPGYTGDYYLTTNNVNVMRVYNTVVDGIYHLVSGEYHDYCISKLSQAASFTFPNDEPPCFISHSETDFIIDEGETNSTSQQTLTKLDLPFSFRLSKEDGALSIYVFPQCVDYFFHFSMTYPEFYDRISLYSFWEGGGQLIVTFYLKRVSDRMCLEFETRKGLSIERMSQFLDPTKNYPHISRMIVRNGNFNTVLLSENCWKYSAPGKFEYLFYDNPGSMNYGKLALDIFPSGDYDTKYYAPQNFYLTKDQYITDGSYKFSLPEEHCESSRSSSVAVKNPKRWNHTHVYDLFSHSFIYDSADCTHQIPVSTSYFSSDVLLPAVERFFFTFVRVVFTVIWSFLKPLILSLISEVNKLFFQVLDFLSSIDLVVFLLTLVVTFRMLYFNFRIINVLLLSVTFFVFVYSVLHKLNT